MVINETKMTEIVKEELKRVLLERYARIEITQLLTEQEAVSTMRIEELLGDVIESLGLIDLSIDYLTAALTGTDTASIGTAQRAGRGARVSRAAAAPQPKIGQTDS